MTQPSVPAGWYPDPWFTGQHRYWTGALWTADVFPDGPAAAIVLRPDGQRPPASWPTEHAVPPPPPPTFGFAGPVPTSAPPPTYGGWESLASPLPPDEVRAGWWTRRRVNVLAVVSGLVIGFLVVYAVLANRDTDNKATDSPNFAPTVPSAAPSTGPTTPPSAAPTDPDASALQGLVVQQSDVPSSSSVQLIQGGDQVTGQTTLDLCNGRYPSEGQRTARLQVVEDDGTGSAVLSTEAVLYRSPAAAAQAMREIASVVAACPNKPVVSPVGEPTVTTSFEAKPDKGWPSVTGVERQAYAFTTTDQVFGQTDRHVAVYLRRGRVLEGVYFTLPGTQPPVDGKTSLADITRVFEQRIAALPAAVVNR